MLKFLFGDNTIRNAVNRALEARIKAAQERFDSSVIEIDFTRDQEIEAAYNKADIAKVDLADTLANEVLAR